MERELYYPQWKLETSWVSCCFCERELPVDTAPAWSTKRINFQRRVGEFAVAHDLVDLQVSKHHTATAVLKVSCQHRPEQTVRMSVNYTR